MGREKGKRELEGRKRRGEGRRESRRLASGSVEEAERIANLEIRARRHFEEITS